MAARITLRDLLQAGFRAISRYTGTVLSVFVAQSLVAVGCLIGVAVILAQELAHLPMFDEAVDGDLVALIWTVRAASSSLFAIGGVVLGAILFWQLASWFLVGGLVGVFAEQPEGRRETARVFGARGAATYLAYARLALCGIPGWLVVFVVMGVCMNAVADRVDHALTLPQLLGPLILAALPALVVAHFFGTVIEYARIELTVRGDSHAPGAVMTYLRTFVWVLKHPLALVHGGLGWLAFLVVTLAYMHLAHGHPMYGTEGAITLFLVRQGVALLRLAIELAVLGGQVAFGRTRPAPPRRVAVDEAAKA